MGDIQVAILGAGPNAICYLTVIIDPKSRRFHSTERYIACPKPEAQFEIVSWVRKNESDGDHNLNSDFEIPEKELKRFKIKDLR